MRSVVFGVLFCLTLAPPCWAAQTDATAAYGHYMGCVDGAARVQINGGESIGASVHKAEGVCADLLAAFRLDVIASFKDQLGASQFEAQKQLVETEINNLVADRKAAASDAVSEMLSGYEARLHTTGQAQQAADAAARAAEAAIPGQ